MDRHTSHCDYTLAVFRDFYTIKRIREISCHNKNYSKKQDKEKKKKKDISLLTEYCNSICISTKKGNGGKMLAHNYPTKKKERKKLHKIS